MKNIKFQIGIISIILVSYIVSQGSTTNTAVTVVNDSSTNTTTTAANNTIATTPTTPTTVTTPTTASLLDNYKCTDPLSEKIEIGANATICVHFFPRPYRMAFRLKVDEYSVLSIGGAYNFATQDTLPQQSFIFQMGNNLTVYPSLYYDKVNKFIIPVFNIVIKVNKGNITDVVWDNDCYSCLTSDKCYSNDQVTYLNDTKIKAVDKNCKQDLCVVSKDTVFQCDPKFYVTWFGTDVNGKQLKSSNLSMSRFRQYAVGSLYNSAKDAFNTTITTLQDTWDLVKTKTTDIINGKFN